MGLVCCVPVSPALSLVFSVNTVQKVDEEAASSGANSKERNLVSQREQRSVTAMEVPKFKAEYVRYVSCCCCHLLNQKFLY